MVTEKKEDRLTPMEKQSTPLSNEVQPEDAFRKAREAAFQYAIDVKNQSLKK
ncbi:hypothetical protein [Hahella sp. CCB-MM4]|uniref:hypothetical protein n=1 Tax=Hahella sp. (strain CCB-MM4) TaxID=1926491 RepID=UPI00143D45A6|nr:hypothetical protein [Hahella sp. CCB-MM4]